MKFSRKMRTHVEGKIRHGLTTSALPIVERTSDPGTHARPGPDKAGATEADQAK
ncbi:MAG TPA: hypothetical protein VHY09_09100 [Candidatus Methylacidiphilales bacterium]|jgi:hypothetical protein|nr:hypothetical protein [Candidatus Methylacidiphilales bacterium]